MRISTNSTFLRVLAGLRSNQFQLAASQERAATGLRIQRPSDDPAGLARVISFRERSAELRRSIGVIGSGLTEVNVGASSLQEASGLGAEARALVVQGLSGTLSQEDRDTVASQIELIREQLLELANVKLGEHYLFSGTATDVRPWESIEVAGHQRAFYRGNAAEKVLRVGPEAEIGAAPPGLEIFGQAEPGLPVMSAVTGAALIAGPSFGQGIEHLELRHDATDIGALAATGVALVNGGAADTFLGPNAIAVDAAAGTVQLGGGAAVALPPPGDPGLADVVVLNELGGTLHLDFTAWTGASYAGTVTGAGSISIDGTSFEPIDFAETDLELVHEATGAVVHIDATGIRRAGTEELLFAGAANLFDTLEAIADDLRSGDELGLAEMQERVGRLLDELDRNAENELAALAELGARSARMSSAAARHESADVSFQGMVSRELDLDYGEVAVDIARAQVGLQAVLASGARILQSSLLRLLG
jgi:flagellin-like hook-associated protein FlgL